MKKSKENENKKEIDLITKDDIMMYCKQIVRPYENLIYKDIKIVSDMEILLDIEKNKMRNIIELIRQSEKKEVNFLLKVYSSTKNSYNLIKEKAEEYKSKLAEDIFYYVKMIENNNLSIVELPALSIYGCFSEDDEWITAFVKNVADNIMCIKSMSEYLRILNSCIEDEYSPLYADTNAEE